jgi:hypothetical protein
VILATLAFLLQASPPAPPVADAPSGAPLAIRLPAGTPIRFVTEAELHSKSLIQGQRFGLKVADDVKVGSALVIPRGTPAVGEVEYLSEKGMFGKSAKFTLRPLFIDLGGRRVNLDGITSQRGNRAVTEAAITTVLTGGLGVFITGKSASLPAGSSLDGTVRDDALVAPMGH